MIDLDIRFPIGLLLALLGLLLVGYSFVADPSIYQRSLGINVNLGWGGFLLVVGGVLLWAARSTRRS